MFHIGNQTAKSAAPVHAPFAYALQRGFSAFEWFADPGTDENGREYGFSFARVDAGGRARLRALADRVRFSAHAPWYADPRTPEGAAALRETLSFATAIGAPVAVVHLCRETADIPDFARALGAVMAPFPEVQVAVENTPESSPDHCNILAATLAALPGGERTGLAFDLGHANCCAATRNDYIRFLRELSAGVRIIHCHVHENWGDGDSHLTLYTGPAGRDDGGIRLFLDILVRRGFAGSLILEQWPQPPVALAPAAARLADAVRHAGGDTAPGVPLDDAETLAQAVLPPPPPAEPQTPRAPDPPAPADGGEGAAPESRTAETVNPAEPTPELTELAVRAAAAMREHTSWRTRLEWTRDFLAAPENAGSAPALAVAAALLRFMATGELSCAEDGGHHRPNHHAAAALAIEEALERPGVPEWLRRRIYPFLPSHAAAYRAAEPLTRIRDIAHRNDIPKEMKLRIKHDLQNKLHRSAGPEDLRTAREIHAQLTAPGASYSPPFVEQFRIFLGELERFFNSPDLGARLDAAAAAAPELADAVRAARDGCFNGPAAEQAAAALTLRRRLAAVRARDAENRQALRLADIELENLAFARLSAAAGENAPTPGDPAWAGLFTTALGHAALSESDEPEMAVLEAETAAWLADFRPDDPLSAARLRATLLRTLRAGAAYQEKITGTFLPAAVALGRALGLDARAVAQFAEGAIRAGVMFQPVKLAEAGEAWLRSRLNLPPWSAVVPGSVRGRALAAATLAELPAALAFPAVLHLSRAAGDEEIPAGVRGIVLGHPLPQLSHLAIRARQAGVALAAAESAAEFAALAHAGFVPAAEGLARPESAPLLNLRVDAAGVRLDPGPVAEASVPGSGPAAAPDAGGAAGAAAAVIDTASAPRVRTDGEITRETCGAKAEGAAWLRRQARALGLFAAPAAVALPFGSMEKALAAAGAAETYERAVAELDGLDEDGLLARLPELQRLITGVPVPADLLTALQRPFPAGTRFAARSSSNGEDLENLAGAGLYDSVVGVDAAGLETAVRQVWASLWTRRAALSRRAAGLAQGAVRMAVLVQEALAPDWSFVLHTADPVTGERGAVSMDLAVGLGETLASANQPGRPYHLTVPSAGEPRLVSCADYSFAARSGQNAGEGLAAERVNYAEIPLSRDSGALTALAARLAQAGRALDRAAGKPLDIEGAVAGADLYIVQARPQVLH